MAEASRNEKYSGPYAAQKERYGRLFSGAKAKSRDFSEAKGNPAAISDDLVRLKETVPGGWGWSGTVARGDTLRIVNRAATPGVSMLFYNAADPTERFNAGDTMKVQWNARLGRGRVLFSDMGRVLASITDDSCGRNDVLTGGSTSATNAEKYGDGTLRNTRDNFILLAAKHGLTKRDIPPCLTLFAPVGVNADGAVQWEGPGALAGAYADLRAELDLLVFVSNCPHPLAPGSYAPKDIDLIIWKSPPPDADDFCRTATEEARRGFENNARYLAGREGTAS
ncbi:urea amidolyase associated protein UAAP1 [Parvibaculum sp.]|uniref:urea amidolyase associated protein UAAP1 n=1 Tax=Parvibaculum sp. TaxID=2024848 RepID=UPI0034A049BB